MREIEESDYPKAIARGSVHNGRGLSFHSSTRPRREETNMGGACAEYVHHGFFVIVRSLRFDLNYENYEIRRDGRRSRRSRLSPAVQCGKQSFFLLVGLLGAAVLYCASSPRNAHPQRLANEQAASEFLEPAPSPCESSAWRCMVEQKLAALQGLHAGALGHAPVAVHAPPVNQFVI